jgi:hypothetical protein
MSASAASISLLKRPAAVALRSAYQRAAASTSSTASARYSSPRGTFRGGVDATPCFRPRNGLRGACLDAIKAGANLGGPSGFRVRISLVIEALDQFARKRRALLIRQAECLD